MELLTVSTDTSVEFSWAFFFLEVLWLRCTLARISLHTIFVTVFLPLAIGIRCMITYYYMDMLDIISDAVHTMTRHFLTRYLANRNSLARAGRKPLVAIIILLEDLHLGDVFHSPVPNTAVLSK